MGDEDTGMRSHTTAAKDAVLGINTHQVGEEVEETRSTNIQVPMITKIRDDVTTDNGASVNIDTKHEGKEVTKTQGKDV